jgi:hypothetical protein
LGDLAAEVLDRLADVERRVAAAVRYRHAADAGLSDPLRPVVITAADVERLLAEGESYAFPAHAPGSELGQELTALAARAGLDAVDVDLLVLAAAPDVDPRFERFYAYLNDDLTLRRATVGMALTLAALDLADPVARRRFEPGSPLVHGGFVEVADPERPFATRTLRVPERVVAGLLGDDAPAAAVAVLTREPLPFGAGIAPVLERAVAAGVPVVYLDERSGTVRHAAAGALVDIGAEPLLIDFHSLPAAPTVQLCRDIRREAVLGGRTLVAGPIDALVGAEPALLRALTGGPATVVLTGRRRWEPQWLDDVPLVIEPPPTTDAQRTQVWHHALDGDGPLAMSDHALAAMEAFRLDPDQVHRAARAARLRALGDGRPVTVTDLQAGARAQSGAGLQKLARRIEPSARWDDLILPPDSMTGLQEIAARLRHRHQVLDQWRLRRGGGRGEGCTALFAGPSGTGKTMAAEVIACELGLDLYTVDLATVVDKYIGETEKNLDRIFREAETVNGVLFFDEADALFGKRSEVKDSHDRYANTEIAYLLQRMERFDGLAVLATNLKANLDEAFARRLDVVVDFPEPDAHHRGLLWMHMLRPPVPVASDVDLVFCAQRFRMTGGHIRNAATTASYLAADEGSQVTMRHVILGVQREYRKLGRLCGEDEFGPYVELLTRSERSPL